MKIKIQNGRYWYKDLVGQEFDVIEKFDLLHKNLYIIKGKENEKKCNWFSKKDCIILDENYLKALETLQLNDRLEYCKSRLEESRKELKLYESGERKEEFTDENKILAFGCLTHTQTLKGQIELLENLLGIIDI